MLSKNEIKYIQSLSHKKFRQEHGFFIAEGPKLFNELWTRKPTWLERLYATKSYWDQLTKELQQSLQHAYMPVEDFELSKISMLQTPQELLAVVKIPSEHSEAAIAEIDQANNWMLALDNIQDPGNMGTLIRTAHWFGIHQIVCGHGCVDVYSPKVVQASMGSIFATNILYADLSDFFQQKKLPVYGALLHGEPLGKINPSKKGIILIGNEGHGISETLISQIDHPVTIPGHSDAESLNAAMAAGILMYAFTNG